MYWHVQSIVYITNGNQYKDTELHHWILQVSAIYEGGISAFLGGVKNWVVLDLGPGRRGQLSTAVKPSVVTLQRSGTPTPGTGPLLVLHLLKRVKSSLRTGCKHWHELGLQGTLLLWLITLMHNTLKGMSIWPSHSFKDHLTMWIVPLLRGSFSHTLLENKGEKWCTQI